MVQSPKRSCEYIASCINEFLLEMRENVKNMSDEEFETQR